MALRYSMSFALCASLAVTSCSTLVGASQRRQPRPADEDFNAESTAKLRFGPPTAEEIAPVQNNLNTLFPGKTFKASSVWAFHSRDDGVVPIVWDEAIINKLKSLGGTPRFKVYNGPGHFVWTPAYREADFLSWMFSQSQ